jgi:Arc/MetJ-type ribon-helix-helix transcriptional regulator
MMLKMVQYNLRLPPEMLQAIEDICESGAFGRVPVSDFIREAIRAKLVQYDLKKLRAQQAAKRLLAKQQAAMKEQGGAQ